MGVEEMKLPTFFKGFYEGFKSFGQSVSTVVNFILLLIVYFVGIGITSIVAKISGKHFLVMKSYDKKSKTTWSKIKIKKESLKNFKRMF